MTREQLENLLDSGRLKCRVHAGLWMVRRNGRTKLWKKSPDKFTIPIKIGFRSYGYITQDDLRLIAKGQSNLIVMDYEEKVA